MKQADSNEAIQRRAQGDVHVEGEVNSLERVPLSPKEPDAEELDFWSFAGFAKDHFKELWPGIDSEASFLVMTMHRATDLLLFDVRQIEENYGLSPAGQRALYVLAICGAMPILRLAELSGMSKAACSSCVRTLQAERYVTRIRAEDDGRSYIICITEAGRQAAEKTFRERNARESRWLDALTPVEIEQFHQIFDKLMNFAGSNAKIRDSL